VETPLAAIGDGKPSPAWLRPLQRKRSPSPAKNTLSGSSVIGNGNTTIPNGELQDLNQLFADALDNPVSANALLSTQDFFDLSAAASPMDSMQQQPNGGFIGVHDFLPFDALGPASAPYDQFETLAPDTMIVDTMNSFNADIGANNGGWDPQFNFGADPNGQL
jgi:hypothetical protein